MVNYIWCVFYHNFFLSMVSLLLCWEPVFFHLYNTTRTSFLKDKGASDKRPSGGQKVPVREGMGSSKESETSSWLRPWLTCRQRTNHLTLLPLWGQGDLGNIFWAQETSVIFYKEILTPPPRKAFEAFDSTDSAVLYLPQPNRVLDWWGPSSNLSKSTPRSPDISSDKQFI